MESHPRVAEVMRERLIRRIRQVEGIPPVIEEAPKKPSGQRRVDPGEEFE